MTILLLIVIYIAFIGLGVPDSLIGSAWPAVYQEFSLPVSYVSMITFTISGCTVLSSIFSDRVLKRFGTGIVTAVSTLMTALALLGYSFSDKFIFLFLLAVPLGLGAGAIDSGLNNYIAQHYSAKHMNFLHCFYGIGVSCSPYLMSLALEGNNWRDGYRYTFVLQLAITVILVLSLPLWKKRTPTENAEESESKILSVKDMVKMPSLRLMWLILFMTNAIEYACGAWGSTFLVSARGFTPDKAAISLTIYYIGMALGRFASGLLTKKVRTWKRIGIGIGIVSVSAVLFFADNSLVATVAFFLIGFGNGSIYPNLIYLTPYNFGEEHSQSIMGSQIAAAYIGVMLTPPMFGVIENLFGLRVFPIFIMILFLIMTISIRVFVTKIKASGNYHGEV